MNKSLVLKVGDPEDDLILQLMNVFDDAIGNGWKYRGHEINDIGYRSGRPIHFDIMYEIPIGEAEATLSISDILLSHDFARAVWGEDSIDVSAAKYGDKVDLFIKSRLTLPAMKFHLARIVGLPTDKEKIEYVLANA